MNEEQKKALSTELSDLNPFDKTEEDVTLTTGVLKTFETVGQLAAYLITKDQSLGVVDHYGQYLTVHDPFDSEEDITFGPHDFDTENE